MNLTKNFRLEEFACHDQANTPVPVALRHNVQILADNLQVLRDHLNRPVRVISGYRTPEHNEAVGGAPHSQHPKAKAGDVQVDGMTPAQVHAEIEGLIAAGKMMEGGLGLYPHFVHYDVRGTRARW